MTFSTFEEMIEAKAGRRKITTIIKIEGVGRHLGDVALGQTGGDGQFRFTDQLTDRAKTLVALGLLERPFISGELPDLMAERIDPLGGFPDLGELTFSLVDGKSWDGGASRPDLLTRLLSTEDAPVTYSGAGVNAVTDTIPVKSSSAFNTSTGEAPGNVLFLGSEAMRVLEVIDGFNVRVARGYLGTDALSHPADQAVFVQLPYLRERRVTLLWVPTDFQTLNDERIVGTYALDPDGIEFDELANVWHFTARSRLKHLHRLSPIKPAKAYRVTHPLTTNQTGLESFIFEPIGFDISQRLTIWGGVNENPASQFYMRNGDREILTVAGESAQGSIDAVARIARRGVLGTELKEIEAGAILRQILVAEVEGDSSFRWSPGPNPAQNRFTQSNWLKTAHWIDLMLILMTSSSDPADGLELVNFDPAFGNWASLPSGWGLGLPVELLNLETFLEVKARTLQYEFTHFHLPFEGKAVSFAKLVDRVFLRPMGGYLSIDEGIVSAILPRIPGRGSATLKLGPEQILMKRAGKRRYEPRLRIRRSPNTHAGSIVYRLGPEGTEVVIESGEYFGTYGQRGYYSADSPPIEIESPAMSSSDTRSQGLVLDRAMSRIYRFHRPVLEAAGDFDLSVFDDFKVGRLYELSLAELPNFRNRERGWTDELVEVIEREPTQTKEEAFISGRLLGYTGAKVGKIAPAMRVTNPGVGGIGVGVRRNQYTSSDADDANLPTEDVLAFKVGNIVQRKTLTGVILGGAETITGINPGPADTVDLSGDFGGALSTDDVLVFVHRDSAPTPPPDQVTSYVHFADLGDQTIGGTERPPWIFGEP